MRLVATILRSCSALPSLSSPVLLVVSSSVGMMLGSFFVIDCSLFMKADCFCFGSWHDVSPRDVKMTFSR